MAKRNVEKDIQAYYKRVEQGKRDGVMHASDVDQLKEMFLKQDSRDISSLICRSWEAGFMVGYRKGKQEQKKY